VSEPAVIKSDQYWLSVVIIGRNEERQLPALFASLPAGEDIEWLYVDSQSEDNSVAVALKHGAKVYKVAKESVYAPGTGRYIGTVEAAGRWILYLDGDMVLRKEFIPFLEQLKSAKNIPVDTAGFVGRTRNLYLESGGNVIAERDYIALFPGEMGAAELWGKPASYHGGAVLYLRAAVLGAGNWNPAVYQLEEIDLLSRIRAGGGILRAVDLPMVDHFTPHLGSLDRLKLNFFPHWQGKKLYGAGQVVTARFKEGGLAYFIRSYPYPFIVLAGLLAAPLLYLFWPPLPLLVNTAIAVWLGLTKKWYYYLVYLGNLLQILRGLGRYKPFDPQYKRVE
jgi:glycosyltransferase involved in cell wall biosynthesis